MKKWLKFRSIIVILPVIAALIALPFWFNAAHASQNQMVMGTIPWNNVNGNGDSTSFQMANFSPVLAGTLACPNMVPSLSNGKGTPTLQIWLIDDSAGGRLNASGETNCTSGKTSWSLHAGSNPAGTYHIYVNCHWGGCGHDVVVTYNFDTGVSAPTGGSTGVTADQLLQNLGSPTASLTYTIKAGGWATSASPGTSAFPTGSKQSAIHVDATIACANAAGSLTMSLRISPNSSLNPNEIVNSSTLLCNKGSGQTVATPHTDAGMIVTFDNPSNTGAWAIKYVVSANAPAVSSSPPPIGFPLIRFCPVEWCFHFDSILYQRGRRCQPLLRSFRCGPW